MNYWFLKLDKNFKKTNINFLIFYTNILTWYMRYNLWQFCFLGFYFDEIFSKTIRYLYIKILSLPGYFFVDRWFSNWVGMKFFNNFLNIFNSFFYFEKLEFFFYFISLLNSFFFFTLYLFLIFFFFM